MINILIVDDEADVREMMKIRLSAHYNAKIIAVSSAENGMDMCHKRQFDIVFFDYRYASVVDGFNLLYDIDRHDMDCVTVMMSGYMNNMQEVVEQGGGLKPDEFLSFHEHLLHHQQ